MAREMLSAHFSRGECACRDSCGFDAPDPRLLELAEKVRSILKEPMHVHSVCRCKIRSAWLSGASACD